jgi:hypothetical protein
MNNNDNCSHNDESARYELRDDGIFREEHDSKGRAVWTRLCSKIEVLGMVRDGKGERWGLRIRWKDFEQRDHNMTVPREQLATDPKSFFAALASGGIEFLAQHGKRTGSVGRVPSKSPMFACSDQRSPDGLARRLFCFARQGHRTHQRGHHLRRP